MGRKSRTKTRGQRSSPKRAVVLRSLTKEAVELFVKIKIKGLREDVEDERRSGVRRAFLQLSVYARRLSAQHQSVRNRLANFVRKDRECYAEFS